MVIQTEDKARYFPLNQSINYDNSANVTVLSTAQGRKYVNKTSNTNKTLSFSVFFDEINSVSFLDSLKKSKQIRVFDFFGIKPFIDVVVLSVNTSRTLVINYNSVKIDLECIEFEPLRPQKSRALSTLKDISDIKNAVLRTQQLNPLSQITTLALQILTAPIFAVLNLSQMLETPFLSSVQVARLHALNFTRSVNLSFPLIFDFYAAANLALPNAAISPTSQALLLNAFLPPAQKVAQNSVSNSLTGESAAIFAAACVFPLLTYTNILFAVNPAPFVTSDFLTMREKLHGLYSDFLTIESRVNSPTSNALKPSEILLECIERVENYLLNSRQIRHFTTEKFTDIIPLIHYLMPASNPEEFQDNYNLFISINNVRGSKLLGLAANSKVVYYV